MKLNKDEAIQTLKKYIKKNKYANIGTLSELLGTTSRMTVFRRLRPLNYLSSYSHSGGYYSLPDAIEFDHNGIWINNKIGFSQHGNLKKTLIYLIEISDCGKTQVELQEQLELRVHNTLLELYRQKKITRELFKGKQVYLSVDLSRSKQQLLNRKANNGSIKPDGLAHWLIIEVLIAIIQSNKLDVDINDVMRYLEGKGIASTVEQVESIIEQFNLKKTPNL